jgi:hypothetical protein
MAARGHSALHSYIYFSEHTYEAGTVSIPIWQDAHLKLTVVK